MHGLGTDVKITLKELDTITLTKKTPGTPTPNLYQHNNWQYMTEVHGTDKIVYECSQLGSEGTWVYDLSDNGWVVGTAAAILSDYGHGMAPINGTDKVLLFGGVFGSMGTSKDHTWIYDVSDDAWSEKSPSKKPEQRSDMEMTYINGTDKVLMYGGWRMELDPKKKFNDTWVYDLSNNTWTEMKPSTNPSVYFSAGMSQVDGTDKIVLFGGYDGDGGNNETWIYTYANNSWWQVKPLNSPPECNGVSMATVYGDDKVVIFGGDLKNNTWIYDLSENNWTKKDQANKPTDRYKTSMATIWNTDKTVIFGTSTTLYDTWVYDVSDNQWTMKLVEDGPVMTEKYTMTPVYGTDKMFLYDPYHNESVWLYDASDDEWTRKIPSNAPGNKNGSGFANLYGTDKILMTGGDKNNNMTWIYNVTTNEWTNMYPTNDQHWSTAYLTPIFGTDRVFTSSGYLYDLSDNMWWYQSAANSPSSLIQRHSQAPIYGTDKILRFGGYNTNTKVNVDSTYIFDHSDKAWSSAATSSVKPDPRYYSEMAPIWGYDKVMLYGGVKSSTENYEDIWIYDLSDDRWSKKMDTEFEDDSFMTMANLHGTQSVVFYNEKKSQYVNDTWVSDYTQYISEGYYTSDDHSMGSPSSIVNISWGAEVPAGTSLKFQVRSAETRDDLLSMSNLYVGPGGSPSAYYTSSPASIWSGHDGDTWMQFKAIFSTTNTSQTPVLRSITVVYNKLPGEPELVAPASNVWLNNSKPLFSWNFTDIDSDHQQAYQWQADDSSDFSSINYDSGTVSTNSSSHTPSTALADGIYYWRVRTKDNDGGWGPFSSYKIVKIDTSINSPTSLVASPASWTNVNSFDVSWTNPADLSYIQGAYYKLDSPPTSSTDGTYVSGDNITGINALTVTGDAVHTVYVWLKDHAGNVDHTKYGTTSLSYDATAPLHPDDLAATPTGWGPTDTFRVTWTNPTDTSGIAAAYYKLDLPPISNTNGNRYTGDDINEITNVMIHSDGGHAVFIWLEDRAGNIDHTTYRSVVVQRDMSAPAAPDDLEATPDTWTAVNSFSLAWNNPAEASGIDGVYYKIGTGPSYDEDGTYISGDDIGSIDEITVAGDGTHTVYIWLKDKVGNVDYLNNAHTDIFYDATAPGKPVEPTVSPGTWTSTNSFTIDWDEPSDTCGVKEGVYYHIGSAPPGSQADGTWSPDKPLTITDAPEGISDIYIWLQDEIGNSNYLNYVKLQMYLDTNPPEDLSLVINGGDEYTNDPTVSLALGAEDTLSGVKDMSFSFDGKNWYAYETFKNSKDLKLPGGDGKRTVHCRVRDAAGNFAEISATITLDTQPPYGLSITINDGADTTEKITVTLDLEAEDATSGVADMALKLGNGDWSDWEPFKTKTTYELTGSEGTKKLYFRVRDNVGNIAKPVSSEIELKKVEETSTDSDKDGVDDDKDAFPDDPTQWSDSDGDGYGDNPDGMEPDAFPEDPDEWKDSDGDGHGDNSDEYPNDPTRWEKEAEGEPETPGEEITDDKEDEGTNAGLYAAIIVVIVVVLILVFLLVIKPRMGRQVGGADPGPPPPPPGRGPLPPR
jgi:hypothetical protein